MKLSESIVCLGLFLMACGGSQTSPPANVQTAADPSSQVNQDHGQHAASMPSAEPAAAPLPSTGPASSPNTTVEASPSADLQKGAAPTSSGSAATAPAAKATVTVAITSTPANAAKSAVVYLEGAPKDRDVTGSMDNRQMAFIPYVLVVTAGAKVNFSNSDPFPHNVFSPDNEKWDMGMIPAHGVRVRKFDKPGVYTVLCNVHPNMKAYIIVVPSSYFAKADKSGAIAIHDVPAGKYKLVAWAPGVKTADQEVTVDGDKSLTVELHR